MAADGVAQTGTSEDLAQEAADLAADTKTLREQARRLNQRATALRDNLKKAGIGFAEDNQTTAQTGEGD